MWSVGICHSALRRGMTDTHRPLELQNNVSSLFKKILFLYRTRVNKSICDTYVLAYFAYLDTFQFYFLHPMPFMYQNGSH